ncbi:MAG: sulfite exporter TauE/SafE family protein [Oscillibacter sp.]|nr:sulfite exporter TauE/SafE family protein [Oscillibacter sp.]
MPMIWLAVIATPFVAGMLQTVTGFGAGMVIVMILSHFLDMVKAPALSSAICAGLTVMLTWRFRKNIDLRLTLFPAVLYVAASTSAIRFLKKIDVSFLSLAFGVFLVLISLYFVFLSNRIEFRATRTSGVVCALVSGICSGLFGIGGPPIAVYFLAATDSKEAYIANLQFLFFVSSILNLYTRSLQGIYTADLIPLTIAGFVSINLGKRLGLKILGKLEGEVVKKIIYAFIGVSGILNIVDYFL